MKAKPLAMARSAGETVTLWREATAGRAEADGERKGNYLMLSAIEYPHWLMLVGALLVLSGSIGLAFRKKSENVRGQRGGILSPEPIQANVEPEMGEMKGCEDEMSKSPRSHPDPAEGERLRAQQRHLLEPSNLVVTDIAVIGFRVAARPDGNGFRSVAECSPMPRSNSSSQCHKW